MYDMCRMTQNPQSAMQSIINQNPQIKNVMDEVQKSGGTAKEAFYAIAKSKGVNPDDIIAMLK